MKTYVMEGSKATKRLETYHAIVAPSYGCESGACPHCSNKCTGIGREIIMEKTTVINLIHAFGKVCKQDGVTGIFHVKGGETFELPFIRDILEEEPVSPHLMPMFTTNGLVPVNESIIDLLASTRSTVIVSLDGSSEEVYAKMRGGDGRFNKATGFIRRLAERGIDTFINCVVSQHNAADLANLLKLAQNLGVTQLNLLQMISGYDQALPLDQFYAVVQQLYDGLDRSGKALLTGSRPWLAEKHGDVNSIGCVGGFKGLWYIQPDGSVSACPNTIGTTVGNVHKESFETIANRAPYDEVETICGHCIAAYSQKADSACPHKKGRASGDIAFCFQHNF